MIEEIKDAFQMFSLIFLIVLGIIFLFKIAFIVFPDKRTPIEKSIDQCWSSMRTEGSDNAYEKCFEIITNYQIIAN